jgi:hypothetical protein
MQIKLPAQDARDSRQDRLLPLTSPSGELGQARGKQTVRKGRSGFACIVRLRAKQEGDLLAACGF